MGSKGSQTVNQTQTYTPNPAAGQAITNALGQVQNVSQTPFQTPVAPVANFSQDQQRAFDLTNQAQGSAQPYFNQAANYFSPNGASQFFNPMASNVMAGMQDIFGQQMKQTTGNLIGQAGGVGGDRIAVGQSELGRQQGLAAGQTLSDMYKSAVQQAQGAAFGVGSLGSAAQNAQLQGAQALLGTGGLQQQLAQAQMNAPYQNELQRIQWPYQNAQFNATNTAALAPGLGGTTNGATTYPPASPWGTIAGIGAAGLGAYGGAGGFSNSGKGGGGYGLSPPAGGADADPSLIGARGGRVPERAYGGAVPGYDEGGEVDNSLFKNSSIDDPMVSEAPMSGMGSDLIPHEQIQGIKPVIPQLPQPQQGGGGGKGSGSDWAKAAGTAAKVAMMFVNRGGRVPEGYADGGSPQPQGFGSSKGGGMGGLMSMFGGGAPSAASVVQHMMQMPGGPPSAASMVQRMPQMSGMFGQSGHGMFGGHAFDPRSYMRPRASGGVVGYADGGAPEGFEPQGDELVPPPYDPRAASRAVFPNATSLLGGEKEVPPPQIEGMAPGKTRSFEDPRLMGAVPEMASAAGMAMPAGEIGMLARPGISAAREALEQAPGIVDRTLAGSGASRTMTNPLPSIMQAARPIGGGALLAGASGEALAQTPEEKTEIGTLETQIGKLKTDIARLRNIHRDDAIFNLRSAKPRSELEIAEAKLKTINTRIEKRNEAVEGLNLEQRRKITEAEEPFRVKHKDFAKDLPMYSMGTAAGLGLLSGLMNKGNMLKPVGIGVASGLGEGALTSMGPSLYDMSNLPLGSKHQKEASDQIWGPVDRGDYSYYKNRVAGDALLNAGIAGTAAAIGSYGPKVLGRVGEYGSRLLGPTARSMSRAAAPVEGTIAKAAEPMESAAASATAKTKYTISEHKLADGSTVNRYVNPNNPNDVRWRIPGSRSFLKKGDYPKLEKEARGGRVSGNPYAFADGGAPSFNDMWSDVDNAVSSGKFDPGSSGDYFGDEAKAARTFVPTPRPRPEEAPAPEATAFAGRQPPMGGSVDQPSPGPGNPYGAPPQGGQPQGGRFIDSPWAALMNAGLGMMAASGKRDARGLPTPPLSAIGEGGMQGMQMLGQQRDAAMKQQTADMAARRLQQQADFHADNYNKLTMAQKVQLMRPVKIGQDRYGREIYGLPKIGPNGEFTGDVTPLDAAGQPTQGAAPGKTPVEQSVETPQQKLISAGLDRAEIEEQQRIPVMAQLAQADRNYQRPGTVPEALEGVSPADARLIKAIADGRQKFLTINGRNAAYNRQIMEKVHEYDPGADETTFQRRQRTTNFFAVGTQGGGGQNIAAMNTWAQHMDEYLRLAQDLNLGQFKTWNEVSNWMTEHGYSKGDTQKKLAALQVAAKAVADEGAKVFAGTNSALADRQEWHKIFDPSNPSSVALAKAKEVEKLVEGRLNSVANQYNEGMRTSHDPLNFIAPKTREVIKRIQESGENSYGEPGAKAPQLTRPQGMPAGSQYSPSRKMWRTPDGKLFKEDGTPVQ